MCNKRQASPLSCLGSRANITEQSESEAETDYSIKSKFFLKSPLDESTKDLMTPPSFVSLSAKKIAKEENSGSSRLATDSTFQYSRVPAPKRPASPDDVISRRMRSKSFSPKIPSMNLDALTQQT